MESFQKLKAYLATSQILAIFSPHLESELHCDASASGFGAMLLQRQRDGVWKVVFHFSKRTTAAEANYHSFALECQRFHVYLAGTKFKIVTDCDSFRLTLSKKMINPRISRWALYLENCDYTIEPRSGKRMTDVDTLSRCHAILVVQDNTFDRTLSIRQDCDSRNKRTSSLNFVMD